MPESKLNFRDRLQRSVNVLRLRLLPVIRLQRRKLQLKMKPLIRKSWMHRPENKRLTNAKLSMNVFNRRLLRLTKLEGSKQNLPQPKLKLLSKMSNVTQQKLVVELMLVLPSLEPKRRLLLQRPLLQKPLLS